MVLPAYRHGLRASEICDLRWDQLDFNRAAPCVRFQAGQRRRRYQGLAGLPRPQEHSAYGALHGTGAYEVQGVLAGLISLADSRNSAFR